MESFKSSCYVSCYYKRYALREVEDILGVPSLLDLNQGVEVGAIVSSEGHIPVNVILVSLWSAKRSHSIPGIVKEGEISTFLSCNAPIGHHLNGEQRAPVHKSCGISCNLVDV